MYYYFLNLSLYTRHHKFTNHSYTHIYYKSSLLQKQKPPFIIHTHTLIIACIKINSFITAIAVPITGKLLKLFYKKKIFKKTHISSK